jgi:hypothetical protein
VEPIRRPRLAPGTGPVAITALIASAAGSAVLGVLVLFALVDLGLGAPAFGMLLAGLAAATAVGGLVAPETGSALGLKAGFVVTSVVSGVALGIAWATATTGAVLLRALLPAAAGRAVTGGALRAFHLAEWVGVCGGALLGGWWARDHGVAGTVRVAAVGWALAAIAVLLVHRRPAALELDDSSNKWLDAA